MREDLFSRLTLLAVVAGGLLVSTALDRSVEKLRGAVALCFYGGAAPGPRVILRQPSSSRSPAA